MAIPSSTTSTSAEEPNKNDGGCLDNFFNNFTKKMYKLYFNLGIYIDGNASKVIYLTIFITVVAGLGFMNYESESRAEKVCTCIPCTCLCVYVCICVCVYVCMCVEGAAKWGEGSSRIAYDS